MNGRGAAHFDGIDDTLAIGGFSNRCLAGKPFTILVVSQSGAADFGIGGNVLSGDGGVPRLYLTRQSFTYNGLEKSLTLGAPGQFPAVFTYTHDGLKTVGAFVNGELCAERDDQPVVSSFGGGNLAMPLWQGNHCGAGDVAEVIVYDRQLSTGERRAIEAYLARKYRIHALAAWQ